MAFSDWNEKCTFCGKWFDYRHNEHVADFANLPDMDIKVCTKCFPHAEFSVRRLILMNIGSTEFSVKALEELDRMRAYLNRSDDDKTDTPGGED